MKGAPLEGFSGTIRPRMPQRGVLYRDGGIVVQTRPKRRTMPMPQADIRVEGPGSPAAERVLTPEALDFVGELAGRFGATGGGGRFGATREELLQRRTDRLAELAAGAGLGFPRLDRSIRESAWQVAPA